MQKKLRRLISGALMFGTVVLSIGIWKSATAQMTAAEQTVRASGTTQIRARAQAMRLCVKCPAIADGAVLTATGETGQTASAEVSNGEAVFSLIPDRYHIGNVTFSFLKNASPKAEHGPCYDDGEILYLTDAILGTITATLELPASQLEAGQTCWFFFLEGETRACRAVEWTDELSPKNGVYTLSCTFYQLPMGTYWIRMEHGMRKEMTLSLQLPNRTARFATDAA